MELGRFWWWATLVLFPLCIHGCFGCWEEERIGLLQFKVSSDYPHKWPLSSWSSTNQERDCCRWERVYCHNTTGRVSRLDLAVLRPNYSQEHWYLNASLFLPFQELNSLDLSFNGIYGWVSNEGLERFSGLSKLEELTFDWNFINDSFLSSIGAITSLRKLNLGMNLGSGTIHIPELGRLNNLQELYLDYSQIDKSILQRARNMTSLNALSIKGCGLQGWPCELSNLQELDLGENDFEGMLPLCLANMTALRLLSLSSNHFNGSISHISSLPSLEYLDLTNNHFTPISFSSFSNLSRLKILIIDNLEIDEENVSQPWAPTYQLYVMGLSGCLSRRSSGTIPNFLRYQYQLRVIDLSHNNLSGSFPNWMLENNPKLEVLHLRSNSFKGPFHVPYHHNPHIWRIDISHNHIGGPIPENLGSVFPNLEYLNISGNEFEGRIPSSLSHLASLKFLDFSNNHLSGTIPKHLAMGCYSLWYLKFSNNSFSGQLPVSLFNLTSLVFLYLNNNHFSGKIPNFLSRIVDLLALNLSDNNLIGMLPRWLGNMSSLKSIVMANNKLEGPIPRELCNLNDLKFLDLSENHLSGPIPSCFNSSYIKHVHLQKNRLSGPLPSAFKDNSILVTLDLSYNCLTGYLPDWIGKLSSLSILLLRHNHLWGRISPHLCHLGRLSMLDLAENRFSGPIPPCLGNNTFEVTDTKSNVGKALFTQNYHTHQYSDFPYLRIKLQDSLESYLVLRYVNNIVEVVQEVEFTTKRRRDIYKGNILNYMSGIDLLSNELTGKIPHELGNLSNIYALNLSYNSLTGSIPITFSKLDHIESLDLSKNDLDGVIPPQLVELNSLAVFNVAHNNLSGRTPERKAQFGTFEKSSYEDNPFLCGPPLENSCNDVPEPPYAAVPTDKEGGEGDSFMDMGVFYISFVVSYAVVVLAIGAIMWINPYWRRAWFYFIEVCMTNCYCFVVLNLRKLRNFKTE